WYELIASYSGRQLSWEKDKLPAISGLAARVAKSLQSSYCAGLWWDDVATGLLWRRPPGSRLERTRKWRSPTFSWASVDGKVSY
ncbi:hypothetical protein AOQ84DRAFT_268592, partial [Glonium stellatum]